MKKPRYAVVSNSLLILAIFGFIAESLRPHIPPNDLNRLRYEKSEFLVMGSRSEVDWRPLEPSAFALARRTGRPILFLIGAPWSNQARSADRFIFSDPEVVSFLNRYMICIRVDGQTAPRWLSAFLPLRRASAPILDGLQIWFLTPEGQLFDNAEEIGTTKPIDPDVFQEILIRVRENLRAVRERNLMTIVPGAEQAADRSGLTRSTLPRPVDTSIIDSDLRRHASLELGGRVRHGRIHLQPNALRYLLVTGQREPLRKLLDSAMRSPLPDWLDGGFYRTYTPGPAAFLDFDKVSILNAEMMVCLAKASILLDEPLYRRFAEWTFDLLARDMVVNGFVVGSQVGDGGAQSRSERNSFPPGRMRELLEPAEREFARNELGLRVETNRVMAVRFERPEIAFDASSMAPAILEKLRKGRTGAPEYAGKRQLDIHGHVVARLLECARLWGDEARLRKADDLYSRIDWFLAGDDVKHTLEAGISSEPYLGDYLAYADASVQHYLAMGRVDSLERGFRVLRRARFLFETQVPGVWLCAIDRESVLWPKDVQVPEIMDVSRESLMAQVIRLCALYGRLLHNGEKAVPASTELLQAAQTAQGQFSATASSLGAEVAGLMAAFAFVRDAGHFVVVGPGCQEQAERLQRQTPARLVAPAFGPVRQDLQKRPPGIYAVTATDSEGPFTLDQAVDRLDRRLRIGN